VRLGLVSIGDVRLGDVRLGDVRLGLVRLGSLLFHGQGGFRVEAYGYTDVLRSFPTCDHFGQMAILTKYNLCQQF
jgi:hypothetical protein